MTILIGMVRYDAPHAVRWCSFTTKLVEQTRLSPCFALISIIPIGIIDFALDGSDRPSYRCARMSSCGKFELSDVIRSELEDTNR
jgi:hypothetical protein